MQSASGRTLSKNSLSILGPGLIEIINSFPLNIRIQMGHLPVIPVGVTLSPHYLYQVWVHRDPDCDEQTKSGRHHRFRSVEQLK